MTDVVTLTPFCYSVFRWYCRLHFSSLFDGNLAAALTNTGQTSKSDFRPHLEPIVMRRIKVIPPPVCVFVWQSHPSFPFFCLYLLLLTVATRHVATIPSPWTFHITPLWSSRRSCDTQAVPWKGTSPAARSDAILCFRSGMEQSSTCLYVSTQNHYVAGLLYWHFDMIHCVDSCV